MLFELDNGLQQGLLPGFIEVGIGFVEHDHRRQAVQRAGQADALLLPAGQPGATLAQARFVTFGQLQNQLMYPRQLRGGQYLVGIHLGKACDVLRDGAGKQLNVLGQIPQVWAKLVFVPLRQLGTVQPHLACQRLPYADQQPGQGRLATTGRPDHAQHLPGRQGETQVGQGGATGAGRTGAQLLHRQLAPWRGQCHALRPGRIALQQGFKALISQARRAPLLPHANQLIDGAQYAAHQNGASNHHPGRDLPLHRQQGTEAEHQGLQGQAHALGPSTDGGGFFAGQILLRQKSRVLRQPTPAQGVEHAHGLNGLGIAQMRAGLLGGLHRQLAGGFERRLRHTLVNPRQNHQQHCAAQGQQPQPGAEHKDHKQIHRKPRRIEKREQRIARRELAQAGEVIQRLPCCRAAGAQLRLESGVVDALIQTHVHLRAKADHHLATHPFQRAHQAKQAEDHQRQHQQGHLIARCQHPVIDLQHVQGRGQHQ